MTFHATRFHAIFAVLIAPSMIYAQGAGAGGFGGGGFGGGGGAAYNAFQNQPNSSSQYAYANGSEFIGVTGSAEVSVPPESLRLVFAVTAQADSSNECANKVKTTIAAIRAGLPQLKVDVKDTVEDFIVVMPTYAWKAKGGESVKHLEEYRSGYRMQTNLHVLCNTEQQANAVIELAFSNGVTDIISFDYWHSKLDDFKQEALQQALKAAQSKSAILLSVFSDAPELLNIDNTTKVTSPQSQYRTLDIPESSSQVVLPYDWRDYLKISAQRPVATYYAGGSDFADVTTSRPPMNPEILVRSEVTLTYSSPARVQRIALEMERLRAAKEE